jgi:hypothetical protein
MGNGLIFIVEMEGIFADNQLLFGHNSIKTTELYTHVAASSFNKTQDLLD